MLKKFSMLVLPLTTALTLGVLLGSPLKVNAQNLDTKINNVKMVSQNVSIVNEINGSYDDSLVNAPVINSNYVDPSEVSGSWYDNAHQKMFGVVDSDMVSTRLFVRSSPSGRIIGSVNPNENVYIMGYGYSGDTVWYIIKYHVDGTSNAKIGWVHGSYLTDIVEFS